MCSEEGAFLAIWTQLTRGLQQVSGKEDTLRQWDGVINTSVLSRLWSTSRGRTKRLHISLTIIVFWTLWTPWRLFPVRRDFPFWCWHISLRRQWRWHIALFASFRRPNHEITGFKPKKAVLESGFQRQVIDKPQAHLKSKYIVAEIWRCLCFLNITNYSWGSKNHQNWQLENEETPGTARCVFYRISINIHKVVNSQYFSSKRCLAQSDEYVGPTRQPWSWVKHDLRRWQQPLQISFREPVAECCWMQPEAVQISCAG